VSIPPLIAVLNGPNLDRLGEREPAVYGCVTWAELLARLEAWAGELSVRVDVRQANGEGELVGLLHEVGGRCEAVVLNAAAYTHTSVAVRDAVLCLRVPVVEVHLSNPARREEFRRRNLLADVVTASVQGFGAESYRLALAGLATMLRPPA
jgi:3-dehydroquinate dehydratase-2